MIPRIVELLALKDDPGWLKDYREKGQLLQEALAVGLLLGKEIAWPVEQYLMARYSEEMLSFIEGATTAETLRLTDDPVFRSMLRFDVLANHLFEYVLVLLRRHLATKFSTGSAVDLGLVCDLALHFHFTGFISGVAAIEATALNSLLANYTSHPDLQSYAVLSLYLVPPATDEIVVEGLRHPSAAQLIAEHQEGACLLKAANVAAVSSDVIGDQYTRFPYPLWRAPRAFMALLLDRLLKQPGSVAISKRRLIAGCGTGRQPLISLTRPSPVPVQIDAIDISSASIDYARRRLVDFSNWVNIQEADIAAWCQERRHYYDNVECVGVLHHTPDDRNYLESMINATKPGGGITLGLYSKTGREDVLEARTASEQMEFGGDLRKLRGKIINSDLKHKMTLMQRRDFYTRSEFKDLVNNNREKNYAASDIGTLLAGLPVKITWFKGIDTQQLANEEILSRVAQLEHANPKIYAGMFLFTLTVVG